MDVYDIQTGRPFVRASPRTPHIDTQAPAVRRTPNDLWAITPELVNTCHDAQEVITRLLTLSIRVVALMRTLDPASDSDQRE